MAQFSVATGLRQANVTRLQWKQISLERRHLWVSATDHKNGRPHSVPLNQAAMDVLERLQGDHSTHVFTYTRAIQSSRSTPRRGAMRYNGPGFKISDGMTFGTPLPHGIERLALPRISCNGWEVGKPSQWSSGMLTLHRRNTVCC